ncbi:MAG TPA: hypothetical protein VMW65_04490 [Chloroflexota bacterium]|nr:hypothetical protein [Chloroflexota bacterium]
MTTHSEHMQSEIEAYRLSGEPWPATAQQLATWALNKGRWIPHIDSLVRQCADDFARAMREEYIVDPQGRTVRAKHAARLEGEQGIFWTDIRDDNADYMKIALSQRRQQIVGDCRQLKSDLDSFNENWNGTKTLQLCFDFTDDLAEFAAGAVPVTS